MHKKPNKTRPYWIPEKKAVNRASYLIHTFQHETNFIKLCER